MWENIITAIALLIISGYLAWQRIKEVRLGKMIGLKPNPERCARAEQRLSQLERDVKDMRMDLRRMGEEMKNKDDKLGECMGEIKIKVARVESILEMRNKKEGWRE